METENQAPSEPAAPPRRIAFPVVGIGASAGGYAALMTLLENMPPSPGMALVVVLHLAPDQPSMADKVLQRVTDLPVVQVAHATPILPDHVYVIPPNRSLRMRDGMLVLDALERATAWPVTIDIFLRTLAEAQREYAVGVVLSGLGSDGTAGLACIKEMGGVTIAQLPGDAEEGAMPRSAIDAGMADFVLAAAGMPRKLLELRDVAHAIRARARDGNGAGAPPFDMGAQPQATLRDVLALLRERTGHDFSRYRRPTLLRRLERRLQVRAVPDLDGYLQLMQKDAAEAQALLKDLLIGVTGFFRDRETFAFLAHSVLPALPVSGGAPLRAWVAACSTGEEAYSLAMLLADRAEARGDGRGFQVFASDLDEHAIRIARNGLYPATAVAQVPLARLERHFTREGDQVKVRKALRDRILFTRHNLLQDPAFSRLDLISCRNFLIYLNREAHRQLLQQFHFALNPGGFLVLGSAESAAAAPDLFEPVDALQRIYRARPVARTAQQAGVAQGGAADVADGADGADGADEVDGEPAAPPDAVPGRAGAAEPAAASRRRGRLFSFADIHLHKDAELAQPSILVNADGDVVHVAERAACFLRQGGGEPTRELAGLVLPALRLALRSALFQARQSGRRADTGPVPCEQAGGMRSVDMQVLPFRDPHAEGELMLVRFVDAGDVAPAPPGYPPAAERSLLDQLDEELRRTRTQLLETIEQAEASSAGMRIYCEEMQATIEELRAGAAELDDGRMAALSRNQELAADNLALQRRAAAAAQAHDDLSNLVASSGVATIFLDRAMCIVRYTPRIADFFNVIPADIGRPLPHITNRLDYPGLADEAARVFDTLQAMEREVRARDGRDYIVRVHPYRTAEDRIAGAVMTFFDISARRTAEQALRASEARLSTLFEGLPVGMCVLGADGAMVLSNRVMQRYLPNGTMPSRDPDRGHRWRAWHADGSPLGTEEFPGARALRGEPVVPGIEMLYLQDDGREIWTEVASVPVCVQGRPTGEAAVIITDIDVRKRAEAAVRKNERRLRELLGELAVAVWETDAGGKVVADSPSWRAYTGQTLEGWMDQGWLNAVHPDDRDYAIAQWQRAVAELGMVDAAFRVCSVAGGWRLTRVRAAPLFDTDGSVRKWIGMNVETGSGDRP